MIELIAVLFIYSIIMINEEMSISKCCVFMLMIIQCALSYIVESHTTTDILNWLIILSVIDILITGMICISYSNVTIITVGVLTIICIIYNILSYLDINYYSYYLNSLVTNHYLQGLFLLVNIKNKHMNIIVKTLILGSILL